ncbi:DUF2481 domain-containing protein [Listeria monocytogenes]|nr:DUF2481 domain-containing protein [Listeria monocytogenes]EAF9093255.1 DUF2481 domain-containing protein [Listeria monocytogenes]EAF9114065.1 DUF2481 domain-containing protein [Listeria monocytogenes]EFB8370088.1 DUF2481 domain-containing protein [Listeria monocytogenes]EIR1547857.1 DUF2481 family protein [Listeria monocytogenes]
MTADTAIKKLRNRSMSIRQMANAIAEHFKVSKAVVFNYTQRNKKEYYQIFDMNEYQKNKEIWND